MPEQALEIRELDHIALYVRDLEASVHFYGVILGLLPLPRPDFPFPGAWFALGSQQLHLTTDTMHREDERHSLHIAFRVDDAHAAYAELVSRGVPVANPPLLRPDGTRQVFFSDPDGYRLEMISF